MKAKIRADQLAWQQGLAESREKAKSLIMAGRIILADAPRPGGHCTPVSKPGQQYPPETRLELLPGKDFVSRGAHKLLTILEAFKLDVSDMVCLDAGASTGGFTDCLLQRGAKKVYAVDVGKNQLHEKLRADSRVVSMEGINLRHAPRNLLPEMVDMLVGDLSFISLTLVLPNCLEWLKPGGFAALLIKPQFELGPADVHKGVVRSEEARRRAVDKVMDFGRGAGLESVGAMPAKIKGPKGNQEYMALFRKKTL